MSKYVMVNFTNAGRPTDIWTDNQIKAYEAFKEELEAEGFVINVAGEFMENEDILEINENVPNVITFIYDIARKYNLESYVKIYTTYKYDIIKSIYQYGLPRIINNYGIDIVIWYEEGDTPQQVIEEFAEVGIELDNVNVSGTWGDKMHWVVNGQIFKVMWEKENENDI